MWPFKKHRKFYVNGRRCDYVKSAFEWYGGTFVILASGEGYIIKHDWEANDYEVISVRSIDGRLS